MQGQGQQQVAEPLAQALAWGQELVEWAHRSLQAPLKWGMARHVELQHWAWLAARLVLLLLDGAGQHWPQEEQAQRQPALWTKQWTLWALTAGARAPHCEPQPDNRQHSTTSHRIGLQNA